MVAERVVPLGAALGSGLAAAGDGAPDSIEGWGLLGLLATCITALAWGLIKVLEAAVAKMGSGKVKDDPVDLLREIRDRLSDRLADIEGSLRDPFTPTPFAALENQRHTQLVTALTELSRDIHKIGRDIKEASEALTAAAERATCPVKIDDKIRRAVEAIAEEGE